jgi:hypothetical protein
MQQLSPAALQILEHYRQTGPHYSLRFKGSIYNMSSADSLQPESIDPDTQQKLGPINTSLTNAGIVGRRIRLNVLDKQSVEEDLRKVIQIGSDIV